MNAQIQAMVSEMNGNTVIHYQITPDSHEARTREEEINYEAFNYYFYENYGKGKDMCYFENPYEAFYNLIKAWNIWNKVLDDQTRIH